MTEKRFILKENGIIDDTQLNIILDGGCDKEDMVDLLNELNDENEQLKSRVEYLERKIDRERTSYQKQHEKWEEEIQKENEELKELIKKVLETTPIEHSLAIDLKNSIRELYE